MAWFKFARGIKLSCAGLSTMGLLSVSGYTAYKRYSPIIPLSPVFQSASSFQRPDQLRPSFHLTTALAASGPLDQPIARQVHFVRDTTGLNLTLFQYQTCPFCCKVRAFLDYNGISYDVVEVNSVFRTQIKWSTYKKVPLLVVRSLAKNKIDEMTWFQMNDSTVIISALETYLHSGNHDKSLESILNLYPAFDTTDAHTNKPKVDFLNKHNIMYGKEIPAKVSEFRSLETKWRKWVDDDFVHLLAPNIYRSLFESFEAFNYVSKAGDWESLFPNWERVMVIYVGSFAMFFIGKLLKKRYKLKDDVRDSLYDGCHYWTKSLDGREFMGGEQPDLSDLAVYGVLSAIEGCSAFFDAMDNNPKMLQWYSRTKMACTQNIGSSHLNPRFH